MVATMQQHFTYEEGCMKAAKHTGYARHKEVSVFSAGQSPITQCLSVIVSGPYCLDRHYALHCFILYGITSWIWIKWFQCNHKQIWMILCLTFNRCMMPIWIDWSTSLCLSRTRTSNTAWAGERLKLLCYPIILSPFLNPLVSNKWTPTCHNSIQKPSMQDQFPMGGRKKLVLFE